MSALNLAGIIVLITFVTVYLFEWTGGYIRKSERPERDALFTLAGAMAQSTLSGGVVGAIAGFTVVWLFPGESGQLANVSFWVGFPILFFSNEMLHYWIHRAAHEKRWLWKIHRTHHSGLDMNAGLLFRYNVFWVLLLPQVWLGAFAVYMGMEQAFVAAILTTFIVNTLTHMSIRWDLWLRKKMPWSEPIWWVIERVITLPDTHHAHHSYGEGAHPNGNYAICVFAFDMIFGTAKIPNRKQTQFGLPISKRLHWAEELFWPMVKKPLLPKPVAKNT